MNNGQPPAALTNLGGLIKEKLKGGAGGLVVCTMYSLYLYEYWFEIYCPAFFFFCWNLERNYIEQSLLRVWTFPISPPSSPVMRDGLVRFVVWREKKKN